ncbi:hypothetical protein BLOT_000285 [Blomia tropicalis]|nr:hypothetical protein BLOT_000285 [Blomia tropicalis]
MLLNKAHPKNRRVNSNKNGRQLFHCLDASNLVPCFQCSLKYCLDMIKQTPEDRHGQMTNQSTRIRFIVSFIGTSIQ